MRLRICTHWAVERRRPLLYIYICIRIPLPSDKYQIIQMNKWEARSAVCWRGESLVMMHTTNEATDDRQQPASSSAAESEAHTRPKPKRIKKKYVKEKKKKKKTFYSYISFFSFLIYPTPTIPSKEILLLYFFRVLFLFLSSSSLFLNSYWRVYYCVIIRIGTTGRRRAFLDCGANKTQRNP